MPPPPPSLRTRQASFLGEPEARQGWLGVEVRATYRLTANPARPAFTSFAYTLYRAKNVRPVEPPVTDPYAIDGYTVDSRCLSYRTWELGAGSAGLRARLGWASADLQQRVQAALGSPAAAARARAILELAAGANPSLQPTRCADRPAGCAARHAAWGGGAGRRKGAPQPRQRAAALGPRRARAAGPGAPSRPGRLARAPPSAHRWAPRAPRACRAWLWYACEDRFIKARQALAACLPAPNLLP